MWPEYDDEPQLLEYQYKILWPVNSDLYNNNNGEAFVHLKLLLYSEQNQYVKHLGKNVICLLTLYSECTIMSYLIPHHVQRYIYIQRFRVQQWQKSVKLFHKIKGYCMMFKISSFRANSIRRWQNDSCFFSEMRDINRYGR